MKQSHRKQPPNGIEPKDPAELAQLVDE
jgi:hypothetical protein